MTATIQPLPTQETAPDANALHNEVGKFLGDVMLSGGVVESNLTSKNTPYGEVAISGTVAVDGAYINTTGDSRYSTETVVSVTNEDGRTDSAHLYTGNRNIAIVRSEQPDGSITRVQDPVKAAEIIALAQDKIIRAAADSAQ